MAGVPAEPVAHSPPRHDPGRKPQPYRLHVEAVSEGARLRAEWALRYATAAPPELLDTVVSGSVFHDLGKLDPENQEPLRLNRTRPLGWDHVDAGVAHLLSQEAEAAAWLVRAHHAPGLPSVGAEQSLPRELRGKRQRDQDERGHDTLIARVDECLSQYVADHVRACGPHSPKAAAAGPLHGFSMRLALSCLVDADHTDSAAYDAGVATPMPGQDRVPTRWSERLCRLEEVVAGKARDADRKGQGQRTADRQAFFRACLDAPVGDPLATCEGPVGIGKTLSITANLLRRARDEQLRHIFIVAPYTNIITQAVAELRTALVLPGENPQEVVAEHHHRADFESRDNRTLATLWRAPVIVTTAVQFFETLASNAPSRLRKLHELAGSAIFLDEAHAALPSKLWPQNWKWMRELAERWGCRFVFASGSLARLWTLDRIVDPPTALTDLLNATDAGQMLRGRLLKREGERVRYETAGEGITVAELCRRIRDTKGPRLTILNTVQNAAVVAVELRGDGIGRLPSDRKPREKVLHVSTALCPRDRDRVLRQVKARLRLERYARNRGVEAPELDRLQDWTLVATSCVEAGVDLSLCNAFRERASAASLIQVGGRVNRHGERGGGIVYDFTFAADEPDISQNPDWKHARSVLEDLLDEDAVNDRDPADVVTEALQLELDEQVRFLETLQAAERAGDYPTVAENGRVIDDDTVLVVVDEELGQRLDAWERVDSATLLRLSVQVRRRRAESLGLREIRGKREIYAWGGRYDPLFLGIMEDILAQRRFERQGGEVA